MKKAINEDDLNQFAMDATPAVKKLNGALKFIRNEMEETKEMITPDLYPALMEAFKMDILEIFDEKGL